MSSDIVWSVVKQSNVYLRRNPTGDRAYFSADPNNLINKPTPKFSSLVSKKAVGVQPAAKGAKGVTLVTKRVKAPQEPKRQIVSTRVGGTARQVNKAVGNAVRAYHPSLAQAAKARASRYLQAQRPKNQAQQAKKAGAQAAARK